jgi:hypothetical protein
MGIRGTYVSKKFMLLVALTELQKLVSWVQVVFNDLHSRMWDFSTVIKLKKRRPWEGDKIQCTQVVDIILQRWFPVDPTF